MDNRGPLHSGQWPVRRSAGETGQFECGRPGPLMKVRQALRVKGDSDGASAGSREIDAVIERGFYDCVPNYRLKRVMLGYWGQGGRAEVEWYK